MSKTTLRELKTRASEIFSSILLFCPNFPPMAQTNTAKKFAQLIDVIEAVLDEITDEGSINWLRIALKEANQSRKAYDEGNRNRGVDLIQQADEHFNNAFSKKVMAPRFTAGESGAALDDDSGFPQ